MKKIEDLSDEEFYKLLKNNEIYLQHDTAGSAHFKHIQWYWTKDCIKPEHNVEQYKATRTYSSVKQWIHYCGGRDSGIWHPTYVLPLELELPSKLILQNTEIIALLKKNNELLEGMYQIL